MSDRFSIEQGVSLVDLANEYSRARARPFNLSSLSEKADAAPSEMLLQQVWFYQRVLRDRLHTVDGRPIRVLHPGFWNHEAGPDFRRAVIQIGGEKPITGDIEIDLVPAGWDRHRHASNPAYKNVVLHVTWEPAASVDPLPSLPLKHALDSTLPELSFWLGLAPKPLPESLSGRCAAPLRTLEASLARDVLRQAAETRLRQKAERLQARARQSGWAAALWDGLFAALGYKRNVWPMRRIAELLPRLTAGLGNGPDTLVWLQARLLGVAGLLPPDFPPIAEAESYLRKAWDFWWREADSFREIIVPAELWILAGIRPANHPARRLALAAHWLLNPDFLDQIERWLERKIGRPDLVSSLEQILQARHDEFWSYRWTLRARPFRDAQPLLGRHRVTDIAINAVLPWLYIRALAGRNEPLAAAARDRFFLWPAGEDNALLKLARARLFGGVPARFLKTAAEQQGLLQIVKDFCEHSNAACENCQFPDLLRSLGRGG